MNAWQGSHHDLAMQEASDETVLGNFNHATFRYNGIETTFFRKNGEFWVRTDGADGALADFQIRYTFGIEPLQQYLVEFPDGRLQALSICWDTRPKSAGGQRWFHLYPDEKVDFKDPLHWTGRLQNWNHMCAQCHSTNLQKNYLPEMDRFNTQWTELDVSCEACHGPASGHLQWLDEGSDDPKHGFAYSLLRDVSWVFPEGEVIARQEKETSNQLEVNVCAQCHSRRTRIHGVLPSSESFLQGYRPALLEPGLYFADGQMQDEVYVWGSFMQSKMHANNVACSDCHNPHSLQLYGGGDHVCAICHKSEHFASPDHHFHSEESPGANCINCHMPTRTYMQIDERRDHSFRLPRPDLSVSLGVPNTCNSCHDDESPEWAKSQIDRWLAGWNPPAHYGEALQAGRQGGPGARERLLSLVADAQQPAIVRATALADSAGNFPAGQRDVLEQAFKDPSPLVRWGAVQAAANLSPQERIESIGPLLADPVRLVRQEAGFELADVRKDLSSDRAQALEAALEEYRESQRLNLDRPEAHLNLGILATRLGQYGEAEADYKAALNLDPKFVPAMINLADVYKARDREKEGEELLRLGISLVPDNAQLHHALGLLLVRTDRDAEALSSFKRALELQPENAHLAYVYALALQSSGQAQEGLAVLEESLQYNPYSREILMALVTMNRDLGEPSTAANYLRRLLILEPQDTQLQTLLRQLEATQG